MGNPERSDEERIFFRIVKSASPTAEDFRSNQANNRTPPRGLSPEQLVQWDGLSVYATEAQARRQVQGRPWLGQYIAELRIPAGVSVRFERTNRANPGHHSLWGSADDVLRCVTRVASAVVAGTASGERTNHDDGV